MSGRELLVATRNAGKLRELDALLAALALRLRTLDDAGIPEEEGEDAIEAHDTFETNALAKARHFARRSGLPAIADDSGLTVRALGGAPGVRSRRWAEDLGLVALGQGNAAANNAALASRLEGVTDRRAEFVCAAAYVDGDLEVVRVGRVGGRILEAPRGSGGFGYDPWFLCDELGRTFGEATLDEKERVSHRGRAFRALIPSLLKGVDGGRNGK